MMKFSNSIFVTCPKGIEGLLLEEIIQLGATSCKETVGGVFCEVSLENMYQICLWSRLANRVYLPLIKGPVYNTQDCYDLCSRYDWSKLFKLDSTLMISFSGRSDFIRNTVFGAQLIKDAIVDNLRKKLQRRCDIDTKNPDCRVHARLHHGVLSFFYDLSGHSLHQRGYRKKGGEAPIKENLACALLMRAGWPAMSKNCQPLIDPVCGSSTFLIEAAMMATDKAPGLDRFDYGFLNWQGHDSELWKKLQKEALSRHEQAMEEPIPLFFGFDKDQDVLKIAERNIHAAGFSGMIQLQHKLLHEFELPTECKGKTGLIIANPPYGERLEESADLIPLYQELGSALSRHALDWKAAIFTSDPLLARSIGLRSHKSYSFLNGTIPCKLYLFDLNKYNRLKDNGVAS
ncbi:MAG: hypothetical protein K2X50_01110 [Gammaproteobacteria bacterium]|nr:hypothetical protein [Gammaproteobacteria bacterium]